MIKEGPVAVGTGEVWGVTLSPATSIELPTSDETIIAGQLRHAACHYRELLAAGPVNRASRPK